ncbi:MAG: gliding motility-associated C-terminal domain-containing protein [Bacteroidetes bacterium]|nr:gliding motility-associated C-terminal domain-containing protein [Bacteroidota bacterium]
MEHPSQYVGTDPPVICFSGNGPHLVQLTISNNAGSVTYSQYVNDSTDCPFFLPNIFTPNNDGVNDMFLAKGVYDFSLQIFSRWGNTVVKSNVPVPGGMENQLMEMMFPMEFTLYSKCSRPK